MAKIGRFSVPANFNYQFFLWVTSGCPLLFTFGKLQPAANLHLKLHIFNDSACSGRDFFSKDSTFVALYRKLWLNEAKNRKKKPDH
jgi:hypothetical protein